MILAHAFKTPIGVMALTWEETKVLTVQMPEKNKEALLEVIRTRFHSPKLNWSKDAPNFISKLEEKIIQHLGGKSQTFSLKDLNISQITPFHKKVYEQALKIPPGKVLTYGDLAKESGSPKAFRAVGQAMARNPFPIVIPCHRVLGSTGALVGYSAPGGVETKKKILEIESSESTNKS